MRTSQCPFDPFAFSLLCCPCITPPPPPPLFSPQLQTDEPKERDTKDEQHDHERAGQPQGCVLRAQAVDAPGFGSEMRRMMQRVPPASRLARKLLRRSFVLPRTFRGDFCDPPIQAPKTNPMKRLHTIQQHADPHGAPTLRPRARDSFARLQKARLSEGFTF